MTLFHEKYRVETSRLPGWNYASSALYFITICTHNREHYFGEIINDKMILTIIGHVTEEEWLKTSETRRDMNLVM